MIAKKMNLLLIIAYILFATGLSSARGLHSNGKYEHLSKKLNEYLDKYEPLENNPATKSIRPRTKAISNDASAQEEVPSFGHPRLLNAVAKLYSKLTNKNLDPNENLIITVGATEALLISFQAFTKPGDEWIIIEPFYGPFESMINDAQGNVRYVLMRPKDAEGFNSSATWSFDREEFENLFNERTRGVVLNNPNNPTGKIFSYDDLTFIANLVKKWNAVVVSDEVYEFATFDKKEHIRIATLPGMFERTVTISSATKILGTIGNRVGWVYGSSELISMMKPFHEEIVKRTPVNNQETIAIELEKEIEKFGEPDSFIEKYKKNMEKGRNFLVPALYEIGARAVNPEGGHHMITYQPEECNDSLSVDTIGSCRFYNWLLNRQDIDGLPLADFFSESRKHLGRNGFRMTMTKNDEALREVEEQFLKWKAGRQ